MQISRLLSRALYMPFYLRVTPYQLCTSFPPIQLSISLFNKYPPVRQIAFCLEMFYQSTFSFLLEQPNYNNPRRFLYHFEHTQFVLNLK